MQASKLSILFSHLVGAFSFSSFSVVQYFPLLLNFYLEMDASMEEMWKQFRLSDKEKGAMVIKSDEVAFSQKQAQFSLLIKLQTNKEYSKEASKSTLYQLWHCSHGVNNIEVGK